MKSKTIIFVALCHAAILTSACTNDSREMPDFWPANVPSPEIPDPVDVPGPQKPQNNPGEKPECESSVCASDTLLNECIEGRVVPTDCSATGLVCSDNACTTKAECTADKCLNQTILTKCDNGIPRPIDCSVANKICKDDACQTAPEPQLECTASECADATTLRQCDDGVVTTVDCGAQNQVCHDGACVVSDIKCCESRCDTDGTTLKLCLEGYEIEVDCNQSGQICDDGECVAPPSACTGEEDNHCGGNILYTCVDGLLLRTDCERSNQICDWKTLSCVYQCDEDSPDSCLTKSVRQFCSNHQFKSETCGENEICLNGVCSPDPCAACTEGQFCIAGECRDEAPSSLVGLPCECTSADCSATVTGAEFKSLFTNTAKLVIGQYIDKIDDDETIVFPKMNSASIRGCEPLAAVLPEGMAAVCLRDAVMTVPDSFIEFLTMDMAQLLALLNMDGSSAAALLPQLGVLMKNGLHFTAPDGYCMAVALDFHADVNQSPANYAVNSYVLQKGGLVDKINFGDHAAVTVASAAAAEAGTPYCPPGSSFIGYGVSKKINKVGQVDVGLDMCLMDCTDDTDCRDGYSCLEVPVSMPFETAEKKSVCFEPTSLDSFTALLGGVLD